MKILILLGILAMQSAPVLASEKIEDCFREYIDQLDPKDLKGPVTNILFPPAPAEVESNCPGIDTNPEAEGLAAASLEVVEEIEINSAPMTNATIIKQICQARQDPMSASKVKTLEIRIGSLEPAKVTRLLVNTTLKKIKDHIRYNQYHRVEIEISLNSTGGDLGAAKFFVEEVRKLSGNPLVTIKTEVKSSSEKGCESACTLMFLAGEERIAPRNAQFGFHRVGMQDKNGNEVKPAEGSPEKDRQIKMRDFWISEVTSKISDANVGSKTRVIEAIMNVPQSDIKYIKASDLEGYVTANK